MDGANVGAETGPGALPQGWVVISGFWRRLLAFIIDVLILGVVTSIAGQFLFDFFAGLGPWGRAVGFAIALVYFGLLNSSVTGGQTLGKRVMRIKVVDHEGEGIGLGRSLARFAIFGVPFFLNGAMMTQSFLVSIVAGIIVFGGGTAILYLFLFNTRTRQSLHDLLMRTYVVRTGQRTDDRIERLWFGHWVILAGLGVIEFAILSVIMLWVANTAPLTDLLTLQESIQDSGKVRVASVMAGKTWGPGRQSKYYAINAVWKCRLERFPEDYEKATREVAAIVLSRSAKVMEQDLLNVGVSYGYDIGLSWYWRSYSCSLPPAAWQKQLEESGGK